MPNNNEYPNQVPVCREERLQPRFLRRGAGDHGTDNELAVKGAPNFGNRVKATGAGHRGVYPDEGGRRGRIGLPGRFGKGD